MSLPLLLLLTLLPLIARCDDESPQWKPPFDDHNAMRHEVAPPWVREPRGRGTWSLLYSCTFTLFLCVYTAIHLNVPPPQERKFVFYMRKTKWVLIALLAPEVVLYSAWLQWRAARDHHKVMELERRIAAGKQAYISESTSELEPLTRTGKIRAVPKAKYTVLDGFFAVMGGYVVEAQDLPEVPDDVEVFQSGRATVTPATLLLLARNGVFVQAPRRTINDKSKADVLAKGLVIFQVMWMVVQAVARKIEDYPFTLLEVHTLAHVICALIMYILWMDKPVDVHDPWVIDRDATTRLYRLVGKVNLVHHLAPRVKNLHLTERLLTKGDFIALSILCAAYGAAHLAAWAFSFPTVLEEIMWKVCCLVVLLGTAGVRFMLETFDNKTTGYAKCSKTRLSAAVVVAFLLVAARLIITVESFASLRRVPAGVYATVEWAQMIPHL